MSSLIPALWNIGILLDKQATRAKHFVSKCSLLGLEQHSQEINLGLRASLAPQGISYLLKIEVSRSRCMRQCRAHLVQCSVVATTTLLCYRQKRLLAWWQ